MFPANFPPPSATRPGSTSRRPCVGKRDELLPGVEPLPTTADTRADEDAHVSPATGSLRMR